MGFRFRKGMSIIPGVRLNLSKTGVSLSLGQKGMTYNIGRKGTRTTVGLPGTGASYSDYKPYDHDGNPVTKAAKQATNTPFPRWLMVAVIIGAMAFKYLKPYLHHKYGWF
jgi:hypothetical protein